MDALTPSSLTYPGHLPLREDGWVYKLNTVEIIGIDDKKFYLNDQDMALFEAQPDFDEHFVVLDRSGWVRTEELGHRVSPNSERKQE